MHPGSSEVAVKTLDYTSNFTELTGEIVAAYVSNNPVPVAELPKLIHAVHGALSGLASGGASAASASAAAVETPTAAQIRKSVRPDGIVSFIDGKTYKTLKRHLNVPPRLASDVRPDLGAAVSKAVMKAIEKEKTVRYLSATDFKKALLALPKQDY